MTKLRLLYIELIQGSFYGLDRLLEDEDFAWLHLMVQQHLVNVLNGLLEQKHEAISQMDVALQDVFSKYIFVQIEYLPNLAIYFDQG